MKHFLKPMLLGASLMMMVGAMPLTATTQTIAEEPSQVDAVTCATPPATPAKKDSTSKNKKEKKKKTKKQKNKESLEF